MRKGRGKRGERRGERETVRIIGTAWLHCLGRMAVMFFYFKYKPWQTGPGHCLADTGQWPDYTEPQCYFKQQGNAASGAQGDMADHY